MRRLQSPIATILVLALAACNPKVVSFDCALPDTACFQERAFMGMDEVRAAIDMWSTINIIGQIIVVTCGIISTVVIALQGDGNRQWTRPIGLVVTALATGTSAAMVSFHVPQNLDRLVEILGEMGQVVNEYDYAAGLLRAGRAPAEMEAAFRADPGLRQALSDLTYRHIGRYSALRMNMLRLAGSADKVDEEAARTPATTATPPRGAPDVRQ